MKKVDYEQLYYDQLRENRILINEICKLKQENQVYKEMLKWRDETLHFYALILGINMILSNFVYKKTTLFSSFYNFIFF